MFSLLLGVLSQRVQVAPSPRVIEDWLPAAMMPPQGTILQPDDSKSSALPVELEGNVKFVQSFLLVTIELLCCKFWPLVGRRHKLKVAGEEVASSL